ncbi:bifunctional DNA primase/polymerase [Streptomyces sp. ASQP_92]|uniref:bifunctional DNA primase/polymerase n=1 Tax=Streptomyces sp. ASQP_92 TaxID=2979116 RepID=UPI0021C20D3E|nr:bifunctional DNA primase/polymerase [Streptomyces sp. ASQP_92]MCT9092621.1 bifunctional DNA primase/polymerase [Streptomyces sp. ASQP_92]
MHHITPGSLPRAAFAAVERGWQVIPLVPGGKRPAIRAWEQRATSDAERVARCWSAGRYNVGIAAGPSALVVVDLDVPKHDVDIPPAGAPSSVKTGADMLALLAEQLGEPFPADTYTVRTASGGLHLYFEAPSEIRLRNTAGSLGWKVDTRAHGGYVVGAGSVVDGRAYTVVRDMAPAPLPEWLTKRLTPVPLPPQVRTVAPLIKGGRTDAYLTAAVTAESQRVKRARPGTGTAPGNRNASLYIASVALGQLVAGGELSATEVTGRLVDAAVSVGLTETEARATVASGLRAGARKPRVVVRRAA